MVGPVRARLISLAMFVGLELAAVNEDRDLVSSIERGHSEARKNVCSAGNVPVSQEDEAHAEATRRRADEER
jgi:hypothetical protein